MYDPFVRGRFAVGVKTISAFDAARDTTFPCEIWHPEGATGPLPLVVYSHHSGGNRRAASYLAEHLSSHGYMVAALDHSEMVAPALARKEGETAEQRAARAEGWIANRVPDVRFLLDHVLCSELNVDADRIGIAGHSFGGWTALAVPDVEARIRSMVALAPGGASNPKPGVLRLTLKFAWGRDVPTLYLVAENDVPLPLEGMVELYGRTPSTKRMVILRRADHLHFIDDTETQHEAWRAVPFAGEAAWMQKEMLPIAELHSGEQGHLFVRGLTLCHMDATLRESEGARRFLDGDIEGELAARGVEASVYRP